CQDACWRGFGFVGHNGDVCDVVNRRSIWFEDTGGDISNRSYRSVPEIDQIDTMDRGQEGCTIERIHKLPRERVIPKVLRRDGLKGLNNVVGGHVVNEIAIRRVKNHLI